MAVSTILYLQKDIPILRMQPDYSAAYIRVQDRYAILDAMDTVSTLDHRGVDLAYMPLTCKSLKTLFFCRLPYDVDHDVSCLLAAWRSPEDL